MKEYNALVDRLYATFEKYADVPHIFCRQCHSEEGINYYRTCKVRDIDIIRAENLQRETADHWDGEMAYKRYIPRILEIMGPPHFIVNSIPEHFFDRLIGNGFLGWELRERQAVIDFINYVNEFSELRATFSDREEMEEWDFGIESLNRNIDYRADPRYYDQYNLDKC